MKKLIRLFATVVMVFTILPMNIFAFEADNIVIIGESDPIEVNKDYVYEFVDPDLANNSSDLVPYGAIIPQYSHSYYTFSSYSIIDHYVGPREKDKFLFSLAGGESLHFTRTISETASLGFQGSVTVGEKEVICGYLGFNIGGSTTITLEIDQTFEALTEYESYSYYSAVDYDMYSFILNKYDVYNNVDQTSGKITGTFTESSKVTVNVKVPKIIHYYKGANV